MLLIFSSQGGFSSQLLIGREDLPVLNQLLPDDSPHDILAEAALQLGEVRGRVVEAVQQHLRHLPLLLPDQPVEKVSLSFGAKEIFVEFVKIFLAFSFPLFSAPPHPRS